MKSRLVAVFVAVACAIGAFVVVDSWQPEVTAQPASTETAANALTFVPADALAVVALDVSALPEIFPLFPSDMLVGPESPFMSALDALTTSHFGFGGGGSHTIAAFLAADENSWAVIGFGPTSGSASAPSSITYQEQTVHVFDSADGPGGPPIHLVLTEDWFVLGALPAVSGVLDVMHASARSYADKSDTSALLTGGDADAGLLVFVAGEGAAHMLELSDMSLPGEVQVMALSIGRSRTRWSLAFGSPAQAADANDALGERLTGISEALRQLEVTADDFDNLGKEFGMRLLHAFSSQLLTERTRHSRSNHIVHLELLGIPSIAFLGSVTLPMSLAFREYIAASRTTEASMRLRRLYDSAVTYYQTELVTATGAILPPQFPASVPLTPAEVPCGAAAIPNGSDWEQPTWEALNFAVTDPHYYSYQFDSSGTGAHATFTATAIGDLDCDGIYSTFMQTGTVEGDLVRNRAGLVRINETE